MKNITFITILSLLFSLAACTNSDDSQIEIDDLKARLAAFASTIDDTNSNIECLHQLVSEATVVVGVTATDKGYMIEFGDATNFPIRLSNEIDAFIPIIGVDTEGYWTVSLDDRVTFDRVKDADNEYVLAYSNVDDSRATVGVLPKLKVDDRGYWLVSYDDKSTWNSILNGNGGEVNIFFDNTTSSSNSFFKDVIYDESTKVLKVEFMSNEVATFAVNDTFSLTIDILGAQKFLLGETKKYGVLQVGVASYVIDAPKGWVVSLEATELTVKSPSTATADYEGDISITITSAESLTRKSTLKFQLINTSIDASACQTWRDFVTKSSDNVLLDYSYAGYKHGEVGPPDAYSLGYKVYNIVDFGANGTDELSDRQAFVDAATAAVKNKSGIIYIPEGRFILHDDTDDSSTILIHSGNIILKGASQEKSIIVMKTPNLPKDPNVMYSSPVMINIKHNSGLSDLTTVTGNAAKGSFSLDVASTAGIKKGDWVCLYLKNNDPILVAEELHPYEFRATMTDLGGVNGGVFVNDYHQVAEVSGNTVTFKEPIMKAVDAAWGWKICRYRHYENVGVEDLTFEGNCKEDFVHHGSWQDDGAYKPINLMRLTNSWMRRVTFRNVSEASSISACANVSVMDVKIVGRRGHAAIRSQGSSRIFIGKVLDNTSGRLVDGGGDRDGAGQFHACGVSKPSMGAVLWNLDWGTDSTCETHASQPRATLVDNCTGALIRSRSGGAESELPNHLADLTFWNLDSKYTSHADNFIWWDLYNKWWKFMPPIIVGYHGAPAKFDSRYIIKEESHGEKVYPESLYEAQLELRLGYVPAWLNSLK